MTTESSNDYKEFLSFVIFFIKFLGHISMVFCYIMSSYLKNIVILGEPDDQKTIKVFFLLLSNKEDIPVTGNIYILRK